MKTLIKPPRLQPGDTVALIAPGGYATEQSIAKARRNIEALGCRVREGASLREVNGNYGGTVPQRLADLHAMFGDPDINMIWPVRGGSGCISLLAHLDFALIRANPKILLGYSDITALHLAIHRHAGLVTFHGPVASSTLSDYSREHMLAVLSAPHPRYTIPMALENSRRALEQPQFAIRTVHAGVATGPLIGGNLSLVAALAGTPYAADDRRLRRLRSRARGHVAHARPDPGHAPASAVDSGGHRLFDRAYPRPVHDSGGDPRDARYRKADGDAAGAGGQLAFVTRGVRTPPYVYLGS
jgi:muramoyltetrapeptide carboxypeptidase